MYCVKELPSLINPDCAIYNVNRESNGFYPSLIAYLILFRSLPNDEQSLLDSCSGEVMLFRLKGPLSFGAAKGITERMMLVRNYKVLILDITDVPRLGVTATLALEDMIQEAKLNARKAYVAGATGRVKERLAKFGVEGLVGTRKEALELALNAVKT